MDSDQKKSSVGTHCNIHKIHEIRMASDVYISYSVFIQNRWKFEPQLEALKYQSISHRVTPNIIANFTWPRDLKVTAPNLR